MTADGERELTWETITPEQLAALSWGESDKLRLEAVAKREAREREKAGRGIAIGFLCGFVTFVSAWIYCMDRYGFLFGFGLGWLPAGILGAMVGFIMRFAWPIAAVLLALAAAGAIFGH